jgi:hypothetical protein
MYMKKPNNSVVIATTILSSVVIGVTIGWFLFPKKRKKIISSLNRSTNAITDTLKVKLHSFMEDMKKGLALACDKANNYLEMEKSLNEKILKITLIIQNDFPELYSFIEEMPVTIPDSNDPEISLNNLNKYYNSLEVMLKNYKSTHK